MRLLMGYKSSIRVSRLWSVMKPNLWIHKLKVNGATREDTLPGVPARHKTLDMPQRLRRTQLKTFITYARYTLNCYSTNNGTYSLSTGNFLRCFVNSSYTESDT